MTALERLAHTCPLVTPEIHERHRGKIAITGSVAGEVRIRVEHVREDRAESDFILAYQKLRENGMLREK